VRRLVLALPVLFLALSLDRVLPEKSRGPAPLRTVALDVAVPALTGRNNGRFGRPGDALNLVFVGTETGLREALSNAGWTEVPSTIRSSTWQGLRELFAGEPLAAFPPMNEYWLDGRRQDMNWAIPIRPLATRHHFRVWDTGLRDPHGRAIWWGSGDYDLKLRLYDLSHVPDPDMNGERDYIAATLKDSPRLERVTLADNAFIPREGANDKGYPFRTDGRAAVIELR
jgi:hypothetical protein